MLTWPDIAGAVGASRLPSTRCAWKCRPRTATCGRRSCRPGYGVNNANPTQGHHHVELRRPSTRCTASSSMHRRPARLPDQCAAPIVPTGLQSNAPPRRQLPGPGRVQLTRSAATSAAQRQRPEAEAQRHATSSWFPGNAPVQCSPVVIEAPATRSRSVRAVESRCRSAIVANGSGIDQRGPP